MIKYHEYSLQAMQAPQQTNKKLLQKLIFSLFLVVELCNCNVTLASNAIKFKTFADIFEKAYVNRNSNMFTHYVLKIRDTLYANNYEYALSTLIELIPDKNIVFYTYIKNKDNGCNRYAFNIYIKSSDTIFIKDKFWNQKDFNALILAFNEHCRMIKKCSRDNDVKLKFVFLLHFNTSEIDVYSPLMWKKMFDAIHLIRQLRNQYNDSLSAILFQKNFYNLNYSQKMEVVNKGFFLELIKFYKF